MYPELQDFVHCCGHTADKFKYLRLAAVIYDVLSSRFHLESELIQFCCFNSSVWSTRLGAAMSDLTFHYTSTDWDLRTIPLFFYTENIGEAAKEHESYICTVLKTKDKLDIDVLPFSGACENESSITLDAKQSVKFICSVRFNSIFWLSVRIKR